MLIKILQQADLDKSITDLEVKASEATELKNQIVQLNGQLAAQQRELGDVKDSSEADKDKMKKAVGMELIDTNHIIPEEHMLSVLAALLLATSDAEGV